MNETITYRENTATAAQIQAHLAACDASFVPPLSTRVSLEDYSAKLEAKAHRIEAWSGEILVGFSAFYVNEPPQSFLTSLSVLPDWQGKGMGAQLLERSMAYARNAGFALMTLEVGRDNMAAIELYWAQGFVITGDAADKITMARQLGG